MFSVFGFVYGRHDINTHKRKTTGSILPQCVQVEIICCGHTTCVMLTFLFMVALCNRADHYIFILFLSSFFLFFSSPNLSGRRLNVYHTLAHGVALVRIYNAGLKRAARGSLKIQDAKIAKNSPSGHHNFARLCLRN